MRKQLKNINKLKIWLIWPMAINLAWAGLVFLLTNLVNAKSCFWGGFVAILPQAVFGFCCFKHAGALQSREIWRDFVKGETLKLLLTALLFTLIYKFMPINTIWFLLTFIGMQFLGLMLSYRLLNH